ncbi:MAG: hypothetical protein JNK38_18005 [Acidobacteria bacterium]|nr:hypothetical protein [Acidobacteriota bacterium]
MNYKPSDLFVGIVDFFSVLLPGAVLAFALQLAKVGFIESQLNHRSTQTKWIVFVLASYLLGHFVFLIGAAFLDDWYDATYAKRRYSGNEAQLLNQVSRIRRESFPDAAGIVNNFKWTRAFVKLKKPELAVDIDSFEAHSKFFRSMTVVSAAGWFLSALYRQDWSVPEVYKQIWSVWGISASVILIWFIRNSRSNGTFEDKQPPLSMWWKVLACLLRSKVVSVYQGVAVFILIAGSFIPGRKWWPVSISFVLLGLSAWRYADQRWKTTQTAYLYFVLLNQPEKTAPS